MAHQEVSLPPEFDTPTAEQCEQQVRRILQSCTFRNATTLQQLFQFLAERTITGTPDGLKEYTIGVEALGRRSDFDPKVDPIVRVQSHRLRVKLREYYEAEGVHDPILIQIPRGHYLATIEKMAPNLPERPLSSIGVPEAQASTDHTPAGPVAATEPSTDEDTRRGVGWRPAWSIVAVVIAGLFAVILWMGFEYALPGIRGRVSLSASNLHPAIAPDPVSTFWTAFLSNDRAPVIAYTDAIFLLDDSNDLFRFRQGASDDRGSLVDTHVAKEFASNPRLVGMAGPLYYENGYTGTGELESVGMLAELLGRMGIKPTIKSSRDITPDDLKLHNVILLGSPFQNVAVLQLLPQGDLSFRNPNSRHEQWRAQIVNAHPLPNEQPVYGTERDPVTHVLKADYSLFTVAPGIAPGRYIADLGGLDTKGTEGATLFATSKEGIEELDRALAAAGEKRSTGEMPLFQTLIRVRLSKGYQVLGSDLTTLHRLPSPSDSPAR